jgi:hypothetical protein
MIPPSLSLLLSLLLLLPSLGAAAVTPLDVPLAFEANRGQADPAARFQARGSGYTMLLAPSEVVVALRSGATPARHAVVRMRFAGGNAAPTIEGVGALAAKSHYLIGSDPRGWRTGVPLFERVRYDGVYPGIDAVFYGNQRALEYDLVVAPGADPATIVLAFSGTDRVTLAADGALVLHAPGGELVQRRPVVYQLGDDGVRRPIDGAFALLGRDAAGAERVGFRIAGWDANRPLVIDPVLTYATYLGGPSQNDGRGIALDANGNAYVTGFTDSATFPNVGGLADPNDDLQGSRDAFVTKLGPTGTLLYSTYLGGTGSDTGNAIAVDDQGSAYVAGKTSSSDFPSVNALPAPNDALQGGDDGFVTKLGPNGDTIVYSTFIGGTSSNEGANAIAVDGSRNAYVAGVVFSDASSGFPVAGTMPNNDLHGLTDAFVAKLATDGSSLVYSVYLGGSGADQAFGIAVQNGEAYVTGRTQSANFPLVSSLPAPNDGLRGFSDGFVTKVNAAGSAFGYSTYLSGSGDVDDGNAIAVDTDGNAYVGGTTVSSNLLSASTASGSLPAPNTAKRGGSDGYVVKLGSTGSTVGFQAFLGGSSNGDDDAVNGIGIDANRDVYVVGTTDTNDFPVVNGLGLQNRRGQNNPAAIVTKIAAAGNAILFSTYLGGTRSETGRAIAVAGDGTVVVTGQTASNDFPVVNAAQATHGSGDFNPDVFVAKIDPTAPAGAAYGVGNVFVTATDFGEVREYTPAGTLVRALPMPQGAFAEGASPSGLAFGPNDHLFVGDVVQNAIHELDATGGYVGTFATGLNAGPQGMVFDGAGNLLVGLSSGTGDVLQYATDGDLTTQYDVAIHSQGSVWIDLGADQRTLAYTSNFEDIAVYDLVSGTQGDDLFVDSPEGSIDFGVRLLPNDQVLLAAQGVVRRIDGNGAVTKTYTPSPAADLFQVSRDPDGTTVWSASPGVTSGGPGDVYAFDLASANVLHHFTAVTPFDRPAIGGLAVFGERTEARNGAPVGTPTPLPTRTPAPEACDDCIDNDFDGDVDRDDTGDCSARADGAELGLDPKTTGKAVLKCGKAIVKAGTKLASARQKHLQKCLAAAFACIQTKPGDAPCATKATATCAKEFGKLPAETAKLRAAIVKPCGAPALVFADLSAVAGLGFGAEAGTCADRGVASLASAGDVADCVLAEHACRAENLVGNRIPRAAELFRFAGRDPDVELPCLGTAGDGNGANVGAKAKAAVKCQQGITKAGAKFAGARQKTVQKCADAVAKCLQTKPGDAKCRTKAGTTCAKLFAKLTAAGKGAAAKLAAAITKSCTKAPLVLADVLGGAGLDVDALTVECLALGGANPASLADVADCIARRHACRVDQMLERATPRLRELLGVAGVALP